MQRKSAFANSNVGDSIDFFGGEPAGSLDFGPGGAILLTDFVRTRVEQFGETRYALHAVDHCVCCALADRHSGR